LIFHFLYLHFLSTFVIGSMSFGDLLLLLAGADAKGGAPHNLLHLFIIVQTPLVCIMLTHRVELLVGPPLSVTGLLIEYLVFFLHDLIHLLLIGVKAHILFFFFFLLHDVTESLMAGSSHMVKVDVHVLGSVAHFAVFPQGSPLVYVPRLTIHLHLVHQTVQHISPILSNRKVFRVNPFHIGDELYCQRILPFIILIHIFYCCVEPSYPWRMILLYNR